MNNPLLGGVQQNSILQNMEGIRRTWGMLKSMSNPNEMLNQVIQSNPKMKEAQELIQKAGGDPEKAFRMKAKEMGVDPEQIMGMLR